MESKLQNTKPLPLSQTTFNRTSMESKPRKASVSRQHTATFNRTSMESKPEERKAREESERDF